MTRTAQAAGPCRDDRGGDGRRADRATPRRPRHRPSRRSPAGDWPTYNRDPGGTRFSPLTDITPANVATLDVAWTYHMKPAAAATPATPEATLPPGHETPPAPAPPAPGQPAAARRANPAGTGVDQLQPDARPPRLRLEREHAARRRRHALHGHALRAGGRARRRDRHREVGLSGCPPAIRRRAASSTGPATPPRRRRSSSARSDAKLYSIAAATGVPNAGLRHRRHRQPRHARDPARPARAQRR